MRGINAELKDIDQDPDLSADNKRSRTKELNADRIAIANEFNRQYRKAMPHAR